jgi:Leucine-rich repeat (LRR) protein
MPQLEVLSLSVNEISSLEPFSACKNLVELYLRKNAIEDINQIMYLTELRNLRILWLSDNPIAHLPEYRLLVIGLLPWLEKLDNIGKYSHIRFIQM